MCPLEVGDGILVLLLVKLEDSSVQDEVFKVKDVFKVVADTS